jgi:lactoylglutathione lyase
VISIISVYEVAIVVRDLQTADAFYRDVLGLQFGLRDHKRNWLFLRAGGSTGMVVLQEDHGEWPKQHFAFAVNNSELERAASILTEKGVRIMGPAFHDWMPGRSVYFEDPDGHALELFARTDGNAF